MGSADRNGSGKILFSFSAHGFLEIEHIQAANPAPIDNADGKPPIITRIHRMLHRNLQVEYDSSCSERVF